MRWIDQARVCAKRYPQNKRELGRLRRYAEKPQALTRGRSIAKPVEAAVLSQIGDARTENLIREIEAVDWAMRKLQEIAEKGETIPQRETARQTIALARVCYCQGNRTLAGAAGVLFIPETTAYRYNKIFLKLVAAKMGYLPRR